MNIRITLGTIAVVLTATAALAQTPAQNIQRSVKPGQQVWITDDQGHETRGRIADMTADRLTVATGRERADVPYDRILRIDRPDDTLANGALIGLVAGAPFGFLAVAAEDARSCDPHVWFDCSNPSAAGYLAVTGFMGGVGSAIGVGIDALIRREPNLYRRGASARLTMLTSPRKGTGLVLSVSW